MSEPKYVDGVNEENMDAFLTALRSGEFPQGQRQLKTPKGYCCLGVASELAAQDGVVHKAGGLGEFSYDGEWFLAPIRAMKWLGIPAANLYQGVGDSWNIKLFKSGVSHTSVTWKPGGVQYVTASELNDSLEMSLAQIADAIENEFIRE